MKNLEKGKKKKRTSYKGLTGATICTPLLRSTNAFEVESIAFWDFRLFYIIMNIHQVQPFSLNVTISFGKLKRKRQGHLFKYYLKCDSQRSNNSLEEKYDLLFFPSIICEIAFELLSWIHEEYLVQPIPAVYFVKWKINSGEELELQSPVLKSLCSPQKVNKKIFHQQITENGTMSQRHI